MVMYLIDVFNIQLKNEFSNVRFIIVIVNIIKFNYNTIIYLLS